MIIQDAPQPSAPENVQIVRIWPTADGNFWASQRLAKAWSRENSCNMLPPQLGVMPLGEAHPRIYPVELGSPYELGTQLEVQDDKIRQQALAKLNSEERRVLGL